MATFGERLTALRKENKWTQEDVAKKLNISRSAYAGYEIDRRVPEYATLEKLADIFDVSIDFLVCRTDDRKKVMSEQARMLVDSLELADDELMEKFDFSVDNIKLTPEDIQLFVAIIRAERLRKKLQTPSS